MSARGTVHAPIPIRSEPPLEIVLQVTDPEVRAELEQHVEGRARHDFALERMAHALREHREGLKGEVADRLREYFDPGNGRFPERVERLIRKDGELEQLLRRQVGGEGSELTATLQRHIGT